MFGGDCGDDFTKYKRNIEKLFIERETNDTKKVNFTIPSDITKIGKYAFSDNHSVSSITIPDSVTYIDLGAFDSCDNLETINIPNTVTYIGSHAFENCKSLR